MPLFFFDHATFHIEFYCIRRTDTNSAAASWFALKKKKQPPSTGDDRDFASAAGWDLQFSRKMHIASCCTSPSRCVDIVFWTSLLDWWGGNRRGASIHVSIIVPIPDNSKEEKVEQKWQFWKAGRVKRPDLPAKGSSYSRFVCIRAGTPGNKNKKKKGVEKKTREGNVRFDSQ